MTAPPTRNRRTRPPAPPDAEDRLLVSCWTSRPWDFLALGYLRLQLISYSREALVTSQQEAQLQTAAAVSRRLNAAIEGIKAQMSRMSESDRGAPEIAGSGAPGSSPTAP